MVLKKRILFLIWKCLFSKYNFPVSNLSTKITRPFVQSFGSNRIYFIFWRRTSFAVETERPMWKRTSRCIVVIKRVGKWEVEPSSSALLRSNILYVSRWNTCSWNRIYTFDFVINFFDILVTFNSKRIYWSNAPENNASVGGTSF